MHGQRALPHMTDILANPQIVGALIALSGFVVAGFSSWILALINRRYDDRRQLRQLAVEAAVEIWKQEIANANYLANITKTQRHVSSLDSFIVHMLLVAELISNRRALDSATIERELRKIRAVSKAAAKAGSDNLQKNTK